MTFDAFRADRSRQIAVLTVLFAGAALRIWQYAADSSLWLDEAALTRNVLERSPRELLSPLSFGQVAPPGFLFAQKAIVSLFGSSELALRAVPLACGLASLPLFTACARAVLNGGAFLFAVLLFALGQPFIYFSSQAKQYASDVTLSLLALWMGLVLSSDRLSNRRIAVLAGLGALIPWFSQPAALVLAGAALGAAIPMLWTRGVAARRAALPIMLVWAGSVVVAGAFAMRSVSGETREYLNWFWRIGYMPWPPVAQVRWLWDTLVAVFDAFGAGAFRTNGGLGYVWPQLFVVATVAGLLHFVRARRDVVLILAGPVAVSLIASLLRLYPLSGRLLVFIVPVLLLLTAAGAHLLWTWFAARARLAGVAAAVLFVAIPIHAAVRTRPPYSIQPLRPVLERVDRLRQPGDIFYVDYVAAQAFLFYAPRFGFEPGEYVIGKCAVADRRDYLRQVDRFRGRPRVWVIGTHLSAVERSLTVGYLERIGRRLESVFVPPIGAPVRYAAYARLYDLSDPRRLASSDAASHVIRELPLDDGSKEWGCAGPVVLGE
jgi:hypothetical protein